VQTALNVAARSCPRNDGSAVLSQVNPGDSPIIMFSLVSATLPLSAVDDYGQITLAQQISQLPGIAQVQVFGSQKFAVRSAGRSVAAASRAYLARRCQDLRCRPIPIRLSACCRGQAKHHPDGYRGMRSAAEYRD